MTTLDDNTVVELDIRDADVDAAEDRAFEVVRGFRWRRDVTRLVVIDDALSIADHESIYQAIQSHQGTRLLCVAVGGPASRPAGVALRTTELLNNQTTATLWVGDPEGVSWPTDSAEMGSTPPVIAPREALRSLREILRLPDVFDQVLQHADRFPYRVASPGHLVAAGQVGPAQLTAAQLASVEQLAGPPEGRGGQPATSVDYWPLITTENAGTDASRLRPGSQLDLLRHRTDELLRENETDIHNLDSAFGPPLFGSRSTALGRTVEIGTTLAEYLRTVGNLFGRVDSRQGLTHSARDRLAHVGVDLRALDGSDHGDIVDRLRSLLFGEGLSLRDSAGISRNLAEKASPAGSMARVADLNAACPAGLLDRLATPPPFPLRILAPWFLAIVFGCGLFAGLTPSGPVTGAVVALAWTAILFAALARTPIPAGVAKFNPRSLVHLVTALAGSAAGVGLGGVSNLPASLAWLCLAVPVVGMPAALRGSWRTAVRSWELADLLAQAQTAATAVLTLLCQVTVQEWVGNDARRFLARGAYDIGTALDAVVGALDGWLPSLRPSVPDDAPAGGASQDLQFLVTNDIQHVVGKVLDESWRALEVGAFDDIAHGVRQRTITLLDDYGRHLENVGIDQPFQPDTNAVPRARNQLVSQLWRHSPEINWLMYDTSAASPMMQLCGPEDVFLLDGERANFRLIRFAPRPARRSMLAARHGGEQEPDITWTGAGHIAGVLRLVPLRSSAVDSSWSPTDHETDVYR